jgi:hypothetical protein
MRVYYGKLNSYARWIEMLQIVPLPLRSDGACLSPQGDVNQDSNLIGYDVVQMVQQYRRCNVGYELNLPWSLVGYCGLLKRLCLFFSEYLRLNEKHHWTPKYFIFLSVLIPIFWSPSQNETNCLVFESNCTEGSVCLTPSSSQLAKLMSWFTKTFCV